MTPPTQLAWPFPTETQPGRGSGFRKPPTTTPAGWSSDEEIYLARAYPSITAAPVISKLIGRTLGAVRRKAQRLGLRRPLRGRAANAAFALKSPPPPAQSGDNFNCLSRLF
ncbi:hypothetical protein OQ496_10820 [Acetobacter suratthaniensis]|uniref:hypothetical protein n=1 Tax=Acetobacter suratthaniensis TaxID=1502841 RepID=UPI0022473949|nr:hypothetical protein [Acetobacter suratthaniensis]MCX2566947.1 hypothetical protein [Acetobacter suratthaniensis]